jgi:MFS family permease
MTYRPSPTVVFSSLGHFYIHLCTAFYFVIVLALEQTWQIPYHQLLGLWTLGSLMVGAVALPAGMLSDRLGATNLMVVFFVGMGGSSIAAGLSNSTTGLMLALTGIGLFAAIYHPVGIPWLLRGAGRDRGKVLGFNGVFGSLGAAGAGLTAGSLIDLVSWRAAFIVPGALCCMTGVALLVYVLKGRLPLPDAGPARSATTAPSRKEMMRAFGILIVTMFLGGVVYHTTQTSLPKVFALRHGGLIGEGTFGIGLLVAGVYTAAGLMQVAGGLLADRFPLKSVYVGTMLVQVPTLWLVASLGGLPLMLVATVVVVAGASALPAENMLLAHYTPARRHGLVFGLKFALGFGAAPLSVQLVAIISGRTGEFYWVFALLAAVVLTAVAAAAFLPGAGKVAEV